MGKTIKLSNDTYLVNELFRTAETRVGTWTDGKPIYRKVITFPITSNQYDGGKEHGLTHLDKFWINENASFIINSNSQESLPVNWYYNDYDWCRTWVNDYQIRLKTGSSISGRTAYVVMEYTKTTD